MSGIISSRVSNLKFMQRAIQKKEQTEAIDKKPEADNEDHWVAPRQSGEKGCVVLLEGDPPATSGRLSFQGFTTDSTRVSDEQNGQDGIVEAHEGVSVSDEAMAEQLAGKKSKKKKKSKEGKEPEHFHRGVKKFKSKK